MIVKKNNNYLINIQHNLSKQQTDWSNIFDHIYCIHFLPYKNRLENIKNELARVNILNSNIFSWWNTTPNEQYNNFFQKKLNNNEIQLFKSKEDIGKFLSANVFNLAINSYNLLLDAKYNNYNRILILEDDIVFLKDINKIKLFLKHFPSKFNIVNFDYWIYSLDDCLSYNSLLKNKINQFYLDASKTEMVNASCISLDKTAISNIIDKLNQQFAVADYYSSYHLNSNMNLKIAIPITNMAIQKVEKQSNNDASFHAIKYRYQKSHNLDLTAYSTYNSNDSNLNLSFIKNKKNKNIKVALVCIAKNEDNYIEEWINYHLKLGFDDIYIYQNNWTCKLHKNYNNVHLLDGNIFDITKHQQKLFYNNFKDIYGNKYDWMAVADVDEFICLKHKLFKHSIKEFLSYFNNEMCVSLYWKYFGDSGLKTVTANNYSVINRFIKCKSYIECEVKTIYNLNRIRSVGETANIYNTPWIGVHFPDNKLIQQYKFNPEDALELAYIAHYACKTFEEYKEKYLRNKSFKMENAASNTLDLQAAFNLMNQADRNEDTDLTLKNFYNDCSIKY